MSAADRLEDGFPHGTPAGYEQGCRSNGACPSKRETGQSCKDANVRAARDSTYRALVRSGAPVSVLAQPEVEAQKPTAPPAPRPAPHAATPKLLQPKKTPKPKPKPVPAPAPSPTPASQATPTKHGTTAGYSAGCRDHCPGGPDGTTCRQAVATYQRDLNARRRAERLSALAAAPTEEAPSASTPPADTNSASPAHSSSTPPSVLDPASVAESTPAAAPVVVPATPLPESAVTAAPSTEPEAPSMSSPTLPAPSPSTAAPTGNRSAPAADATLLANVALAFGALEAEAPVHQTPFDGIPGIMADLLRVAWLDGFKAHGRAGAL